MRVMDTHYQKLTPKQRRIGGYTQAWLGSDHLLILDLGSYAERYQRFALADIQAIVIVPGRNLLHWQVVAVALSLGWFLLTLGTESELGQVFYAISGAGAGILAIRDLVRGQRCTCMIQTAVSHHRLLSASRLRVARKFLAAVTPAIESAQGTLATTGLNQPPPLPLTFADGLPAGADPVPLPDGLAAPSVLPPELPRSRSYLIEIFFAALLLDSVLVWFGLSARTSSAFSVFAMVYMAEFGLVTIALFHPASRQRTVFAVSLLALACMVADLVFLTGPMLGRSFMHLVEQGGQQSPSNPLVVIASTTTVILAIGWRAAVALLGLGLCYFERRGEAP